MTVCQWGLWLRSHWAEGMIIEDFTKRIIFPVCGLPWIERGERYLLQVLGGPMAQINWTEGSVRMTDITWDSHGLSASQDPPVSPVGSDDQIPASRFKLNNPWPLSNHSLLLDDVYL